jgi:hypothetical protein
VILNPLQKKQVSQDSNDNVAVPMAPPRGGPTAFTGAEPIFTDDIPTGDPLGIPAGFPGVPGLPAGVPSSSGLPTGVPGGLLPTSPAPKPKPSASKPKASHVTPRAKNAHATPKVRILNVLCSGHDTNFLSFSGNTFLLIIFWNSSSRFLYPSRLVYSFWIRVSH